MEKAKATLKKKEDNVKELTALIATQKGFAKKELQKVLKKSKSHIDELKDHIKEGSEVLAQKQDIILKMENTATDKQRLS